MSDKSIIIEPQCRDQIIIQAIFKATDLDNRLIIIIIDTIIKGVIIHQIKTIAIERIKVIIGVGLRIIAIPILIEITTKIEAKNLSNIGADTMRKSKIKIQTPLVIKNKLGKNNMKPKFKNRRKIRKSWTL